MEHGHRMDSSNPHTPTTRRVVTRRSHSPLTLRPPDPHKAWSRDGVTRLSPSDRQSVIARPTARPARSVVARRSHSPLTLRPPDLHGAWSRDGVTRPSPSDRQTRTERGRETESLAPHPPTARPARSVVAKRSHSPPTRHGVTHIHI